MRRTRAFNRLAAPAGMSGTEVKEVGVMRETVEGDEIVEREATLDVGKAVMVRGVRVPSSHVNPEGPAPRSKCVSEGGFEPPRPYTGTSTSS